MSIRVVVVDDQDLVRAGFVSLLSDADDIDVVGQAGQGEEALRLVRATHPDVVLMDVRMPILDGIEATRRITADPTCQQVRVVMLTTFGLDEYVFGALRAGAVGFLLKDTPPEELLRAVQLAANGDALLSPSITRRLVDVFAANPPRPAARAALELTDRESSVLSLVAQGLSNVDISTVLQVGPATVKTYVSRLLTKLDAQTRVHLVIYAYETGFVVRDPTPEPGPPGGLSAIGCSPDLLTPRPGGPGYRGTGTLGNVGPQTPSPGEVERSPSGPEGIG